MSTETPAAPPATFNLADIWEAVVPLCADRVAVISGDKRLTYAEVEERANRLANALLDRGVEPGQHVGLYLENGNEYLEAMLAAYKVRAVPININYRYVEDELRYLFVDADLVGVIYHRQFAPRVAAVTGECPLLAWHLAVEDGSGEPIDEIGGDEYEAVLAASSPELAFGPRSSDDPYVIYTGGTTGMPKGVVWRSEDAFYACIGGGDPMRLYGAVEKPDELVDRIIDGGFISLPVAPLMHAAAQWTSLSWLLAGGTVILMPGSLDAQAIWQTVQDEKANLLIIVGDAVARPLIDEWDRSGPYDVSSLFSVGSGGAPLTPSLRARMVEIVAPATLADGFGSSETGAQGSRRTGVDDAGDGPTKFQPFANTVVLDEETLEPVEPGSGAAGRVALCGRIPQGYYNDPEKTAATFVELDGERWVLTGDMATVDDDGSITLLGRGSGCINTGGEKVYPEEVEAALRSHPDVYDAVVVGVDDDRWGSRVAGVVAAADGTNPSVEDLMAHCRSAVAGYKVPKQITFVDRVERSPAGKPDYRWAKTTAEKGQQ
jgi:acyl-CoA synthetase (AMP-forming)/AMP-acid ligase II